MTSRSLLTGLALVLTLQLSACGKGEPLSQESCLSPSDCASPIAFVVDASDATGHEGATAHFSVVVASNSGNLVFAQWQVCDPGVAVGTCAWHAAPGVSASFDYDFGPVSIGHDGTHFRAVVTAQDGQQLTSKVVTLKVIPATDPIRFSDDTFSDGDWSQTVYVGGLGGVAQSLQVASGGHPGAYRSVKLQINAAPNATTASSIFLVQFKAGAVYSPAASGAITAVDYTQESQLISGGGGGQATSLALRQGSQIYYAVPAYELTPEAGWTPKGKAGMVAADFVAIAPDLTQTPQHPDFSASGAPIEFGFLRANSTSYGGAAYATHGGIDNWTVLVRRAP